MKINEIDPGEKVNIPIDPKEHSRLDRIVSMIQTKCSDALVGMSEAQDFLYRGTKGGTSEEFVGRSRNDRRAKSSSYEMQVNIDKAFTMAGFQALRSNSIYATSNMMDASMYGSATNLFLIFPVNGFKFTWSPIIDDLYVDIDRAYRDIPIATKMDFCYREADKEGLELFLKLTDYRSDDFGAAVASKHEIMISGEYIALNAIKYRSFPEIRGLIGVYA